MPPVKPKLAVFDLDYTLWPFYVDTHPTPPFHKKNGKIYDRQDRLMNYYPEVPSVLKSLHDSGIQIGVASRTSEIVGAHQLVELFGFDDYVTFKEIYPGCKVQHFERIKKASGLDFKDMIFFDDEQRNVTDLKKIGVTSILVRNGVNKKIVDEGLKQYQLEHGRAVK